MDKRNRGITLIILVITIIILLILAGLVLVQLTGQNGLLSKIKLTKEKYSVSKAKEKLELAIADLIIEQESKNEVLTKKDLPKINNNEIDVRETENFPIEVICEKYKFNIDENFNVTYIEEHKGTKVTYTTDPVGYTNKDEINILIVVNNEKGIKTIEYPNGDKIVCNGKNNVAIDYKVNKNGTYIFKIIDNENKEIIKNVVISQIDKIEPQEFNPIIEDVKRTEFRITMNAKDSDETDESKSVKSGIERYEIYVNNIKYETSENSYLVTGLDASTNYSVYVIAFDRAGNRKKSDILEVIKKEYDYPTLYLNGFDIGIYKASDALGVNAFDGDYSTYVYSDMGSESWFKINPECWGKYLTIYCQSEYNNYSTVSYADEKKSYIKHNIIDGTNLCTKSFLIPNGVYMCRLCNGTFGKQLFTIYEVWCSEEDLSGNMYINDLAIFQ